MAKDQSNWLAGVLPQHDSVSQVERIGRGVLRVYRKERPPAIVGIVKATSVNLNDVTDLLATNPKPQIIINIPNELRWTGEAISALRTSGVAFGFMYDLYRALNMEDDVSDYCNPEMYYVERMLKQHHAVTAFSQLSDRVYLVNRLVDDDLVIALSQEYEMTADVVRMMVERHGTVDIILKTNPYGRISTKGREAATKLGILALDFKELHEHLT